MSSNNDVAAHGAGAPEPLRAPPRGNGGSIANPVSSTGYDSTSPYMEQNETKRGAF